MRVTFDGDFGVAVPDNRAGAFVEQALAQRIDVTVGTVVLFNQFRLAHKAGADIEFWFEEKHIKCVESKLSEWPRGRIA